MAKTADTLIREFANWLGSRNAAPGQWYVGVSAQPLTRLTEGHGLDGKDGRDSWKYDWATSAAGARTVERHFLQQGFDGSGGGGDASATGAYVCFKSSRFRR